jgi:hypothetical protein
MASLLQCVCFAVATGHNVSQPCLVQSPEPCSLPPQALLRGVQLPADTYDRTHELRLYDKVAMTLNADIERNKLATFATVGECHSLQPSSRCHTA